MGPQVGCAPSLGPKRTGTLDRRRLPAYPLRKGGGNVCTNEDAQRGEGERRRDVGMDRAAHRKKRLIWRGQLRLLRAILSNPARTATTDDACRDRGAEFDDGGKWRGSVPLALARRGLIQRVGFTTSSRPSRHAGYVAIWRADDDDAVRRHIIWLKQCLSYGD